MRNPIFYGSVHLLFYRDEDRETLLLKRQNTGFADGLWSVVAGRIDGREEVIAAAIREAKEEAGVVIAPADLEVTGVMHRRNGQTEWIDFYLKVRMWSGVIANMEPHKCEELRWYPVDALPEEMVPYVRAAVLREDRSLWFESYGWAPSPTAANE
ncbi:NUDIX hydrolase [Cohnella nanjingensis]|uniref:NUDIX domain-containing protein n=1 Tax=Cohnella nanjingensis TaxID=1387779 RepID=A0A7X0RQ74_9BACL|nr:NUDIX domain-containing protein [Cohnella nanjingensis]MBB6671643.1 NUDIX domain-containing protein [Cohnella nanjingensis]